MLNPEIIRADFKILDKSNNKKNPIYFDNASMSLKPRSVVDAMNDYYFNHPTAAGRSSYKLAEITANKIKDVRRLVSNFINARNESEVIFIRNTTEAINLIAHSLKLEAGDIVLTSDKEHNSNLIPWQLLVEKKGIQHKIVGFKDDGTFDLEAYKELVKGVKLVAMVHTSNLDGTTIPAKEIIEIAHANAALVLLDAAQSAPHQKIDVRDLDVDFLAFSGHKMLGPTGTGVLYGKYSLLEKLEPFMVGGGTVEYSTYTDYKMLKAPEKFEAGLQDYAGIIGLGEAIKYLEAVGLDNIKAQELKINTYITQEISKLSKIKIIGPLDASLRSGIISFYVEGEDMHQFASLLDEMSSIMIRSGQHCVHSWFNDKKIKNSARISLYFYNTMEEAEILVSSLIKIMKII